MILKTTLTTRDLAPHTHNSFLLFPSIFMITITHDDLLSDPGHQKCVVNIIITWIIGIPHGFTDAESYADGLMAGTKLPQEKPVPAGPSWTMSSSKMSKIQRHAAAQVAWTRFSRFLSP